MQELDKLIANCASVHLFPDGKVIFKFPLGKTENKVLSLTADEKEKIINEITKDKTSWRLVIVNDIYHAVKNPDHEINTEIPKKLPLTGKMIVFGPTGSGKSTFLSTIGRMLVEKGENLFTIESPMTLSIRGATRLENTEDAVTTVLLCRPDTVLFDEIRERYHYKQLKDLSLACENIIGSLHATDIFEAIARFASLNGERTYGETSTIISRFVQMEKGDIINWFTLKTTLSSQLTGEFYADGERPVTTIYDKDGDELGWIFYFANDINIVKATRNYYCPVRDKRISQSKYNDCYNCSECKAVNL